MIDFISSEERTELEKPILGKNVMSFIYGVVFFVLLLFIASEPMRNL